MRAACSSAMSTASPNCPMRRWPAATPTRASATSSTPSPTSPPTSCPTPSATSSTAGAWRRPTRRLRCRSPGSRSSSGSTRTSPGLSPGRQRRHPGVEQGLRAHRLQERHRRQAAGRRCRLRHARRAPRPVRWFVGSDVGFARGPSHRPAQRRDHRRRHRDERRLRPRRAALPRRERGQQQCSTAALPFAKGAEQACDYADQAARIRLRARPARRTRRAGHRRARRPRPSPSRWCATPSCTRWATRSA